jgi:hypothetical protein
MYMCREMPVTPVDRVVDPKRIIGIKMEGRGRGEAQGVADPPPKKKNTINPKYHPNLTLLSTGVSVLTYNSLPTKRSPLYTLRESPLKSFASPTNLVAIQQIYGKNFYS